MNFRNTKLLRVQPSQLFGMLSIFLIVFTGCTFGPELGKVTGKLTIPGHTSESVRIEFHPDAAAGTKGPSSVGETDADGKFHLTCSINDKSKDGAVVGKHRVVLQDLRLAQSETGRGIPVRFSSDHSAVLSTPLVVEVKAGQQTIEITPGKQ